MGEMVYLSLFSGMMGCMKVAEEMNSTDRKIASMYMAGESTFLEGKNWAAQLIIDRASKLERKRKKISDETSLPHTHNHFGTFNNAGCEYVENTRGL